MPEAIQIETQSEQQGLPNLHAQAAARSPSRRLPLDRREERLDQSAEPIKLLRKRPPHFGPHTTHTPMPQVIDSFAALCRDAAAYGTKIVYELMPFAMIDTLRDTLAMLKGADQKNGGIIFDLWHVVKLGIPDEEISRFPLEYFFAVELNDGTFTAPWSLHEDTINHRRLCGEGEFDIRGFLDHVWKAGYHGPIGIEVLNKELRKRPLDELAKRSFNATLAQFSS